LRAVGLMGDGETGERTIATGEGRERESEGRVEVVEMARESFGFMEREASMIAEFDLIDFVRLWCS
jgi:hypothetical protein